jgi:hypothetical protein
MRRRYLYLATLGFGLFACNRDPIAINESPGVVLGREKCNTVDSLNYWLISLSPLRSDQKYGKPITYHGKTYPQVVKSATLIKQFQDSTQTFMFVFDPVSNPTPRPCNVSNPETFDVPVVNFTRISNYVK